MCTPQCMHGVRATVLGREDQKIASSKVKGISYKISINSAFELEVRDSRKTLNAFTNAVSILRETR